MRSFEDEFEIAKDVVPLDEQCQTIVIPDGFNIEIFRFHAVCPTQPDAVVKLVWDWGPGKPNELIWPLDRLGQAPKVFKIDKSKVNGVRELALCLDNSSSTVTYSMAGYAKFRWFK